MISINKLIENGGFFCESCRKKHPIYLRDISLRRGALEDLPAKLKALGVNRPFLLCDLETES